MFVNPSVEPVFLFLAVIKRFISKAYFRQNTIGLKWGCREWNSALIQELSRYRRRRSLFSTSVGPSKPLKRLIGVRTSIVCFYSPFSPSAPVFFITSSPQPRFLFLFSVQVGIPGVTTESRLWFRICNAPNMSANYQKASLEDVKIIFWMKLDLDIGGGSKRICCIWSCFFIHPAPVCVCVFPHVWFFFSYSKIWTMCWAPPFLSRDLLYCATRAKSWRWEY